MVGTSAMTVPRSCQRMTAWFMSLAHIEARQQGVKVREVEQLLDLYIDGAS